jgi:hypothetical protein
MHSSELRSEAPEHVSRASKAVPIAPEVLARHRRAVAGDESLEVDGLELAERLLPAGRAGSVQERRRESDEIASGEHATLRIVDPEVAGRNGARCKTDPQRAAAERLVPVAAMRTSGPSPGPASISAISARHGLCASASGVLSIIDCSCLR